MDTEVESLANIKAMEGRNLDASVNGNTLVSGEKADGTFGVFNFFQGIKNFFKGISALGTLASGSRLPVTDSNGNVTYTTMNDINNYVVNNALADYVGKGKTIYPTDLNNAYSTSKKISFYRTSTNVLNLPVANKNFIVEVNTYNDGTNLRITQIARFNGGESANYTYTRTGFGTITSGITWTSWEKVATENRLTLEKTVTLARGSNTITFATNYSYLLVASGNNYGQGICFVSQGYSASVVKGTILANNISFG
ncbi:MAG: hypothetical protein MJ181_10850, partial [Treponema sp.]|nr:hypothetical protein [Treponema sp.]